MKEVIPQKTIWRCDVCKQEQETPWRPKRWAELILQRDAYDFQGNAVASNNIHRLLCGGCCKEAIDALNGLGAK